MGIDSLLRLFKDVLPEVHISSLAGRRAAIDGLSWLYKSCCPAALELLLNKPTSEHLDMFFAHINLLKHYKIEIIVVFDGRILPVKLATLKGREDSKAKYAALAEQTYKKGDLTEARKYSQRAIRITAQLLHSVYKALKDNAINYVVAPYQSDSQLAYLVKSGVVDFAISEDSDLIAYQIPRVLYKLNLKGLGQLFDQERLSNTKLSKYPELYISLPEKERIYCCILAGCDYLQSLRGVGLKTLLNKLAKKPCLQNLLIQLQGLPDCPPNFESEVKKVYEIFKHQPVWDISTKTARYLTPIPANFEGSHLGSFQWYSQDVANGVLDVYSLQAINYSSYGVFKPGRNSLMLEEARHQEMKRQAKLKPLSSKQPEERALRSPIKMVVTDQMKADHRRELNQLGNLLLRLDEEL